MLSACNQITWDIQYCHVWTRLPFLYPYLSQRGGSSPYRRCCVSVRPTGCCWVRVPPEGVSAQWFSPNTSQVDRSSAPTPPPSVLSGHSAHTPNTQQSPAAPPCVHSHLRAKGQGRERKTLRLQNHSEAHNLYNNIHYQRNPDADFWSLISKPEAAFSWDKKRKKLVWGTGLAWLTQNGNYPLVGDSGIISHYSIHVYKL